MIQKHNKSLLTVISMLLIFGLAYLVFQNFYRPIEDPTAWQTFTSNNGKVTINHPKEWKVKESLNGNDGEMSTFITTKDDYTLSYTPPSTLTNLCIFDDTDVAALKKKSDESTPGYFEQASNYYTSFTQFGDFRRTSNNGNIIVCYLPLSMETGFSYLVPEDPDSATLSTMDQIVLRSTWGGMLAQ